MIGANFVVDILRNHEWARKLPWRQIEMLAKLAEERHFQPGEVLFQLGDIADHFYVIASGTVGMPGSYRSLVSNGVRSAQSRRGRAL
jgi:hypothetical protein